MGDVPMTLHNGVFNAVVSNKIKVSIFGPSMYAPKPCIAVTSIVPINVIIDDEEDEDDDAALFTMASTVSLVAAMIDSSFSTILPPRGISRPRIDNGGPTVLVVGMILCFFGRNDVPVLVAETD